MAEEKPKSKLDDITWVYSVSMRKVKKFDYVGACRYTGYQNKSIRLYLTCGHEIQRKASCGVPKRARCTDCEKGRPPEKEQYHAS